MIEYDLKPNLLLKSELFERWSKSVNLRYTVSDKSVLFYRSNYTSNAKLRQKPYLSNLFFWHALCDPINKRLKV